MGKHGFTPLWVAIVSLQSLPLVVWLLDEKCADVSGATTLDGRTPLHYATRLDILVALLNRCADPTQQAKGEISLMTQALYDRVDNVAHQLQDPRVRDTINAQEDMHGLTALRGTESTSTILLLHQAGANPAIPDTDEGETLLTWHRRERPNH